MSNKNSRQDPQERKPGTKPMLALTLALGLFSSTVNAARAADASSQTQLGRRLEAVRVALAHKVVQGSTRDAATLQLSFTENQVIQAWPNGWGNWNNWQNWVNWNNWQNWNNWHDWANAWSNWVNL